jgi:acetyltransferase-like isoleucine patch superfamily enzyme
MSFWTKDALPGHDVGVHSYGVPTLICAGEAKLRIGKFCSISSGVTIFLGAEHRTDWISTYPFSYGEFPWWRAQAIRGHPRTKGDVTIGNDVWIGYKAMILSGVTVGDGACIGAMSVVAQDVRPYAVVAGNPPRVIRYRFMDDDIRFLLELKWWDWSDDLIRDVIPLLMSNDIEGLKKCVRK